MQCRPGESESNCNLRAGRVPPVSCVSVESVTQHTRAGPPAPALPRPAGPSPPNRSAGEMPNPRLRGPPARSGTFPNGGDFTIRKGEATAVTDDE